MEKFKKRIIALTGATGAMGQETLKQLAELTDTVEYIKVLVRPTKKGTVKRLQRKYGNRIVVVYGDITNKAVCQRLVADCDIVFNLAGVIPPLSDHKPHLAEQCNDIGTRNLVDCIKSVGSRQPKLVHISTVAVYGNRNSKHMWGRVGDPLLPSVYDMYSLSKVRGEFYVMESGLDNWVVLRQTAMLYKRMLADNISDGLMFHTCFNAPLEWVTARDSGRLVARLVQFDTTSKLDNSFWKKCYNIGGGIESCYTGYDTFFHGFKLIGGSTEKFLQPNWNCTRNFHGMWFLDSHKLNDIFNFVEDTFAGYWQEIGKIHWYYALAKILPASLISKMVIKPLLKSKNSPDFWNKDKQLGKIFAHFGNEQGYNNLPKSWDKFPLLVKGRDEQGKPIDYKKLLDSSTADRLSHGFDDSKADSDIDYFDVVAATEFRGGKLLSSAMVTGDLYTPLQFECSQGHKFWATPYSVLRAGHWCLQCFEGNKWNYDILAKKSKFFSQIWYDSHEKDEDVLYWLDENYNINYKKGVM